MGRYKVEHIPTAGPFPGQTAKKVVVTDNKTGNKAEAEVWGHQSYEDAEDIAMGRLQEENEEDDEESGS